MNEFQSFREKNEYVFAAYVTQLRAYYEQKGRQRTAALVREDYSPDAFATWFQERIKEWCEATGQPLATPHTFRKTALQFARKGADLNLQVAQDAKLSPKVMMTHYVSEEEEEFRQASNRTYERICLGLSIEVATRYGYVAESDAAELEGRLLIAAAAKDWTTVKKLAGDLAKRSA